MAPGQERSDEYWETKVIALGLDDVSTPVVVTAFSDEYVQTPLAWAERAYRNLIYYHQADKGGHFAAWEEPELFGEEVRSAFRSLR